MVILDSNMAKYCSVLYIPVIGGVSEKYAVNAAIQALGSELRSASASTLNTPRQTAPSPRLSPAPARRAPSHSPAPTQNQQQVVNGFSAPQQYHREERNYKEGDTTKHVTTETSKQQVGGTTITKVKRETVTQFGQKPTMFSVSNVAGSVPPARVQQPGIWTPAGGPSKMTVSAPSGVHVQQNPDESVTMTIGFNPQQEEVKENIAPKAKTGPPMFKVSKYGSQPEAKTKPGAWSAGTQPQPFSNTNTNNEEIPLLPDEEAEFTHHLESLKNPMPPHLQRVMFEGSGSSREGTPDSPGYLTRRRIEEFATHDSEDESNKRKMFADSAFYDDPQHKYPTIEEQVKMARKVAMSLLAPANKKARGHRMFMRRMVKSQKWTADEERREEDFEWGEEEEEEKYYNPNPWAPVATVWQPEPAALAPKKIPVPPPVPTALFQTPTLPTGPNKHEKSKALSADEFEKMRLFESKSDHTQVSPAMCFSLAEDLRNMKGKGGKLFAKRVARSEKWVVDENPGMSKPNPELIQKIAMQAMAGGAMPMPGMGAAMPTLKQAVPSAAQNDGPVVNRLKEMIDPPKPKMTPWDAAANNEGNCDPAFEHLMGYNPYGQTMKGDLASKLDTAAKVEKGSYTAEVAPMPDLPTSGQPAKLPEFSRKIKPWGNSDRASSASGAAFSSPVQRPAEAAPSGGAGFRSVNFRAPLGCGASSTPSGVGASTASSGGGAASFGGDDLGYCDL